MDPTITSTSSSDVVVASTPFTFPTVSTNGSDDSFNFEGSGDNWLVPLVSEIEPVNSPVSDSSIASPTSYTSPTYASIPSTAATTPTVVDVDSWFDLETRKPEAAQLLTNPSSSERASQKRRQRESDDQFEDDCTFKRSRLDEASLWEGRPGLYYPFEEDGLQPLEGLFPPEISSADNSQDKISLVESSSPLDFWSYGVDAVWQSMYAQQGSANEGVEQAVESSSLARVSSIAPYEVPLAPSPLLLPYNTFLDYDRQQVDLPYDMVSTSTHESEVSVPGNAHITEDGFAESASTETGQVSYLDAYDSQQGLYPDVYYGETPAEPYLLENDGSASGFEHLQNLDDDIFAAGNDHHHASSGSHYHYFPPQQQQDLPVYGYPFRSSSMNQGHVNHGSTDEDVHSYGMLRMEPLSVPLDASYLTNYPYASGDVNLPRLSPPRQSSSHRSAPQSSTHPSYQTDSPYRLPSPPSQARFSPPQPPSPLAPTVSHSPQNAPGPSSSSLPASNANPVSAANCDDTWQFFIVDPTKKSKKSGVKSSKCLWVMANGEVCGADVSQYKRKDALYTEHLNRVHLGIYQRFKTYKCYWKNCSETMNKRRHLVAHYAGEHVGLGCNN
ncbi:hypothetical protein D9758_009029 [Tetrapyrgos nigripes]|uniref:C2H2-type domain-containing protein n=1 Tax=Tetrapyrgos nigripes TaxID=182062 RepID=A0A8H5GA77_9AGAR|nr:hypothetical protein D9758_009029 [Tetrapyrgos nigripes]